MTHLKRFWCWERLKAGREGDDGGRDGWMASPTQWTWVRVNSGGWWWTRTPGEVQSMRSQRVGHDWATELNRTESEKEKVKLSLFTGEMIIYIENLKVKSKLPSRSDSLPPHDCSAPGFPVLHHLPEFAQVHVHCIGNAIQLSHPLSPFSPSAFNLSQHQNLFQWVGSSHQVGEVLELQHQSFQWVFRVDFL